MVEKKFDDILLQFCEKKEFNEKQIEDFKTFIQEMFITVSVEMKEQKYDFINVKYLGTFFLKVWTVAKELKDRERKILIHPEHTPELKFAKRRMDNEIKYFKELYKRMTDSFLKRKLYLLERKQEIKERKMTQSYLTDMSIDEFEDDTKANPTQEEKDELERDFKTGMAEQGPDS